MNKRQCPIHPLKESEFICIIQHNCERILCSECYYKHNKEYNGQSQYILSNEDFKKLFLSTLDNKLVLFNHEELKDEKAKLLNTKLEFLALFDKIQSSLDRLYMDAEQITQSIHCYKQRLLESSINDFSSSEINTLATMLQYQEFIKLNSFKSQIFNSLKNIAKQLNFSLQTILKKGENFVSKPFIFEKFQFNGNQWNLECQQLFGLIHGKANYKNIENSNDVYAGEYQFNLRNGYWQELKGEYGKYLLGKKIGRWKYLNEDTDNGGYYNYQGQKIGEWIEPLNLKQDKDEQIILRIKNFYWLGKYLDGKKIGQKWEDIHEDYFSLTHQVVWIGEWQNGKKIKQWNIVFRKKQNQQFKKMFNFYIFPSGGGEFNQGIKKGSWVDINEEKFNNNHMVLWKGFYNNGIKSKTWSSHFLVNFEGLNENQMSEKIGGGQFDEEGRKIKHWIDINEDKFSWNHQVIWQGEYLRNVIIGQWLIKFRNDTYEEFKQIGSGLFQNDGIKNLFWREIDEKKFNREHNIIWEGQYDQGKRTGLWKIFVLDQSEQIGEGEYHDGIKNGPWTDINEDEYNRSNKSIWKGKYLNGQRINGLKFVLKQNQMEKLENWQQFDFTKSNENQINVNFESQNEILVSQGEQNNEIERIIKRVKPND